MDSETICLIEEWQANEPYDKVKTLTPVFADMNYAINQVEDLVFSKLYELKEQEYLSSNEFATAVGSIPLKWTTQESDVAEARVYMHSQPQLESVYTISQLPLVRNKLADLTIQ